jgi:hypothetical protein
VLLAEHPAADLQDLLLDLARTVSVSPRACGWSAGWSTARGEPSLSERHALGAGEHRRQVSVPVEADADLQRLHRRAFLDARFGCTRNAPVSALVAHDVEPPALAPPAAGEPAVEDLDEDELVDELPEEIHELLERIDLLRNAVADLRINAEDPVTARRELRNVREEVDQVTEALQIAYGHAH